MTITAAVDVGGSFIKLGLVDTGGTVLRRAQLPVPRRADFSALVDRVAGGLRSLQADAGMEAPDALGIAMPGHVEPGSGTVLAGAVNLPVLVGQSLSGALGQALALPAVADNDGTCALLAERTYGVGRTLSHFALLTLGTGVGGGVVAGGVPLAGVDDPPAEIGHLSLDARGLRCPCGNRGCLERYVSGPALVRAYHLALRRRRQPRIPGISAEGVIQAAALGEPAALDAVTRIAGHLAHGLGILLNVVRLQACVLGGGLSQAGEVLLAPVRAALPRYVLGPRREGVRIEASVLGNDLGLLGAAALVRSRIPAA